MELKLLASYPHAINYIPVTSFDDLNDQLLRTRLTDLICDSEYSTIFVSLSVSSVYGVFNQI